LTIALAYYGNELWRRHGLQPHRGHEFKLPTTDPALPQKSNPWSSIFWPNGIMPGSRVRDQSGMACEEGNRASSSAARPGRRRGTALQSDRALTRVSSNGPNGCVADHAPPRWKAKSADRAANPQSVAVCPDNTARSACRGCDRQTIAGEAGRRWKATSRDNRSMSRFEMPLGDGALAVAD
jgi:hypothetical protein